MCDINFKRAIFFQVFVKIFPDCQETIEEFLTQDEFETFR